MWPGYRSDDSNAAITLRVYSRALARRDASPLGERLAAFMRKESGGCVLVVPTPDEDRRS